MGQGAKGSAAESSAGWLSDICDHHPDGLLVADGQALLVYVNPRAARIIGTPASELLGQDIRKAMPLQEYDGRSWWDATDPWNGLAIRTGHREKLLIIPGLHEVLVTARYVRPGRNMPVSQVVVAIRDAEARRRAEANSSALISTVAHELRSPLTSVKGFSSTLLRRWDRFTDDQKRLMLQTIEADADRVTRLITELLTSRASTPDGCRCANSRSMSTRRLSGTSSDSSPAVTSASGSFSAGMSQRCPRCGPTPTGSTRSWRT